MDLITMLLILIIFGAIILSLQYQNLLLTILIGLFSLIYFIITFDIFEFKIILGVGLILIGLYVAIKIVSALIQKSEE